MVIILQFAALLLCGAATLQAQYLGLNLRGDLGMKSGSQPGPGYYVTIPLFYRADYDKLRGPGGTSLAKPDITINVLAAAVAVTTKWKLLGANYGVQVVPLLMNQRLELARPDVQNSNSFGFGDLYVQPINLGWKARRADFLAAYGFYAPSGAGHRSLEMWAHEFIAGSTLYIDEAKTWHAAGTMFYDIHQRKSSVDVRVGNFLTVEGGLGKSFLKGAANAGLAYVMQWKVTDDSGSGVSPMLDGLRNRAYGIGPEITLPFFAKGALVGLAGFRYTFEMNNSTNFQGNNLVFSLTLASLR